MFLTFFGLFSCLVFSAFFAVKNAGVANQRVAHSRAVQRSQNNEVSCARYQVSGSESEVLEPQGPQKSTKVRQSGGNFESTFPGPKSKGTPHAVPMTSQVRHQMDAPGIEIASRTSAWHSRAGRNVVEYQAISWRHTISATLTINRA